MVNAIPKSGPADQAGLTLGELVTMVDGKDIRGITPDAFCALKESDMSSITTESGVSDDVSPIEGFFDGGQ